LIASAVLALMLLIASTLVLGLITPYQHAPRGSAAAASQPPCLSRRALGQRLLAGSVLLVPRGAHALFESAAQSSLSSLANVQPKVKGVINEVAEFDRRRARMAADGEDDAYVLRFSRIVLSPVKNDAAVAASELKSERATALASELEGNLARLDLACREKASDKELTELKAIDSLLTEFLAIAKESKQNFDLKSREDINGYSGATPVLYNKFLFRAG
jgi:hypothetical protein